MAPVLHVSSRVGMMIDKKMYIFKGFPVCPHTVHVCIVFNPTLAPLTDTSGWIPF